MAVIEILTFTVTDDVSDDDVRAADAAVQTEFAYAQKGLIRRTTARDGRRWLVVQLWASDADAAAAVTAAATHAAVARLHALADPTTLSQSRYTSFD